MKRIFSGFFLTTLLVFLTSVSLLAQSGDGSLGEEAYWQLLADLLAEVESYQSANDVALLHAAATQLIAITSVRRADGTLIPVDHSVLVTQLNADPPVWSQIKTTLATLLAEREDWPDVRYDEDAAALARADLQEILAELEVKTVEDEQLAQVEEELRGREWQFDPDISTAPAEETSSPLEINLPPLPVTLLAIIAGLILVAVLFFAFRHLALDFSADADLPLETNDAEENLTAQTALSRAQALSKQQDYRAAVRYLYLSTLLILEEKGLFRYNRTRTNREYIQSVSDKPEMAQVLGDVVNVFDRVWYGYEPIDDGEYSSYQEQVERLRQQRK